MAKLSTFKRLIKENFEPDDQELIGTIGLSINDFADAVINALNKNISIDDNLKMEYKEIDVKVDASGKPVPSAQAKLTIMGKIRGVLVVRADNLDSPSSFVTSAPFVSFSQSDQLLIINNIKGLVANNKYRLTLLALG